MRSICMNQDARLASNFVATGIEGNRRHNDKPVRGTHMI
jgi:hypothetical protein